MGKKQGRKKQEGGESENPGRSLPSQSGPTLPVTEKEGAVTLSVRVRPRASRDAIEGIHGDALAVRLSAPPVEGAANEALRRLLAKSLGVSLSAVEIIGGQTGRSKIIRIQGVSAKDIHQLYQPS